MLSGVELMLAVAAVAAGITGSWSPCGFSMIATLGPGGHTGGQRTTLASCLTFALTAPLGGVVTFGGLSLVGSLLHSTVGDSTAYTAAAGLALLGALGELAGLPVVPQIRRQVPEQWRRVLPLPVAGALYGFLLGLGFTTFVLTYAVPVLAAVALAVGNIKVGLILGVAFGAGRALPVVFTAPLSERRAGIKITDSMAQRPVLLRSLRAVDGAVLAACGALLIADPAFACLQGERGFDRQRHTTTTVLTRKLTGSGENPSTYADRVAWEKQGRITVTGFTQNMNLVGEDPALGGDLLALRSGEKVQVLDLPTLAQRHILTVSGAGDLAISNRWLVVRSRSNRRQQLISYRLGQQPGELKKQTIATVKQPSQLGRPAVSGDRAVYTVASRRSSRIVLRNLVTGRLQTVRSSKSVAFGNPSLLGDRVLYTVTTPLGQQLRLGKASTSTGYQDRLLYYTGGPGQRDSGHEPNRQHGHGCLRKGEQPRRAAKTTLGGTALGSRYAYLTLLRNKSTPIPEGIVRIKLSGQNL